MSNLIIVNPNFKSIDDNYFNNYGGDYYSNSYLRYTYHPKIVLKNLNKQGIFFKTLLDAGCASGELVSDFRKLGIEAYGIDNNKKILEKSICPSYTSYLDIKNIDFLKENFFDVIYLNSLMYLLPQEILPTLNKIFKVCSKAVYFCNPLLNETSLNSDKYRKFLAKQSWWDKQFLEAGFQKVTKNIYTKKI
jgi:2-polyprenyl-3-methyl-5-hydroxy-6-metoxy-1,4-benzoquinol methylase